MYILLPEQVNTALDKLKSSGKEGFAVGGCVRDAILSKQPNDWDIATNALPDETEEIFKDFRLLDYGKKHGTVTVFIDNMPLEITTYRSDGSYSDGRHPDGVSFLSSIEGDLSRRDFTINAMAYNHDTGLIDLFGGRDDIKNRVIRCVGDSEDRFREDALRILRALRFSSVLNFDIADETSAAVKRCFELLNLVSQERKAQELLKLLDGENVFNVLMNYRYVFSLLLPVLEEEFDFEQCGEKHAYDVWEHTCVTVANIETDFPLRLTMLLHDCGKPRTHKLTSSGESSFLNHALVGGVLAKEELRRLRLGSKTVEQVSYLVSIHDKKVPKTREEVKRYLCEMGEENFRLLLKIRKADRSGLSEGFRDISAELDFAYSQLEDILEKGEPYEVSHLAVTGDDLREIGITGKKIKDVQQELLRIVTENPQKNERGILLDEAKKFLMV